MPNRRLSPAELETMAKPLLEATRRQLANLSGADQNLLWALRRKVYKELIYDERGKPMQRVALKRKKRLEQHGLCAACQVALPDRGAILDRLEAMAGYTLQNTRLLCVACDTRIQIERGYA